MHDLQNEANESSNVPSGPTRSSRRHETNRVKDKRRSYQNTPNTDVRAQGVFAKTPVNHRSNRDPRKFRDGMVLSDYRKAQPKLHEDQAHAGND